MRVFTKDIQKREIKTCNPGSRYAIVHKVRIDDNGHKILMATGEKKNAYAIIQKHADEVDIYEIMRRCEIEGYQILDAKQVYEGDVTMTPKTMMEAMQKLQDAENNFNKLPIEVREKFNYSFTEYIAQADKDLEKWSRNMGFVSDQKETETEIETPIKEGGEDNGK